MGEIIDVTLTCSHSEKRSCDMLPSIDRPTILVVDDDIELTEMLGEYLDPEGFAVEIAHDGNAGRYRTLSCRPAAGSGLAADGTG